MIRPNPSPTRSTSPGWCGAILSSILAMLCSFSNAQSAPTPTSSIRLRFLAFQPNLATREAYLHDPASANPGNGIQVHVKSYLNHETLPAVLASRNVVFTKSPDPASIKKPELWLSEATLPADLRSAVLLFMPEPKNAKFPFRIMVIDDSRNVFPPGTFRITNLSPSTVRIELEKRPWIIKPGTTEFLSDPPVRHGNLCGMKTYVFENQSWRRIASGLWPHPGKKRVIQLLYYHPAANQVQLRAFDDVMPADDPAPPPPAATP